MLINIDWLTVNTKGTINTDFKRWELKNFVLHNEGIKTAIFNVLLKVDYLGNSFATIVLEPHSKIIDANLVQIKIDNSYLYDKNGIELLKELIELLQLKEIKISRIDICSDFKKFENGYCPHQLISDFASSKIRKIGRSTYQIFGKQTENGQRYSYLRFGTTGSRRSVYLYNKTEELNQVKDKLYISDAWSKSGLTNDNDNDDVWRLEVSLKMGKIDLLDDNKNSLMCVSLDDLKDETTIIEMYLSVVQNMFKFTEKEHTSNITYSETIELFNITSCTKLAHVTEKTSIGRSEKIHLNYLVENIKHPYYEDNTYQLHDAFIDYLQLFLSQKRMWSYFLKRHFDVIEYLPRTLKEEIINNAKG